jgi:cytochrome c
MINRIAMTTKAQRARAGLTLSMLFFISLVILLLISPLPGRAAGNGALVGDHAGGDADRGKQLFEKRCTGCHSLDQNKEGPRLRNVYGRRAGSIPTFNYSDALKSAHLTWDDVSLNQWLTDTESLVPDNDMSFHVPKADERADIIRFLKESSGK